MATLQLRCIALICGFLAFSATHGHAQSYYPEVRLFIAADQDFVAKFSSVDAAQRFIQELIAATDAIYRSQVGLTITLAGIDLIAAGDPLDRSDQSLLLASFADYGESHYRALASYDAAHLLVGTALGGAGGIAYPSSACGDTASAPYAYGVSQPDLADLYQFNPHLLAHELGHNLGAEHDAYPDCAKKTIMCVGQIGGEFSLPSLSAITTYTQQRASYGCFPMVPKADPLTSVRLTTKISGSSVVYRVTGSSLCTSLAIVASPTAAGLKTMFGYLQLGRLTPAQTITARSKKVPRLRRANPRIYFGAYCDGQLAATRPSINAAKIRSARTTASLYTELLALQRGFR